MSTLSTWGLVGNGNIGREVIRQLGLPGVAERLGLRAAPEFIAESKRVINPDGSSTDYKNLTDLPELPDVVFIAIPSSNDGKISYDYISYILQKGKLVITAEKGALANHYTKLKAESDDFARLGITATVGGGTRLLQIARQYCQDIENITQIHLALNGTLSAIMDWVAPVSGKGIKLNAAAQKAAQLGYAEPGSESAAAIIRGEAEGDIPKKLAIFCNSVGLSRQILDWQELRFSLTEREINQAVDPDVPRRFLVSLYPLSYFHSHRDVPEGDIIGGFSVDHGEWRLVGGFRRIEASPLFRTLADLSGPGNGMVVGLGPDASDGVYAITGPGAGVNPTVNAMIDDYIRLKGN